MTLYELLLPQFGMGMQEGEIVAWRKAPGDRIAEGEIIVEINSEKSTVEVESPFDGEVVELCVAEGETVPVATVIARIKG